MTRKEKAKMDYIIGAFIFIFGTVMASFLGVVIFRVPEEMSIVKPNSFCPSCHKEIKWYDNIPLISYIVLKGKCRYCKEKIGVESFLLELFGGLLFLGAFLSYRLSWDLLFILPLICILIVIAGIDAHHQIIYDWSWIVFLIFSVIYVLYQSLTSKQVPWANFIGAGVGFVSFLLIRILSKLIAKKEALGMGDVILMGIAGLLLGWGNWLLSLMIGSLVGTIVEVTLLLLKKREKSEPVAFGPYLVTGILVGLLVGQKIINWYLTVVM